MQQKKASPTFFSKQIFSLFELLPCLNKTGFKIKFQVKL